MPSLKKLFISIAPSLKRAFRTFLQAFIAVWLATAAGATSFVEISNTRLLETAAVAGIVALATFVWNALEDASGRSVLKE